MATYAEVFKQLEQKREERELAHLGVDAEHDKRLEAANAQWRGDRNIEQRKGDGELTQANLDKIDARHTDSVVGVEASRANGHQTVDQRYGSEIATMEKELQDIRQDKASSQGITLTAPPPPAPAPPSETQSYQVQAGADFATRPDWGTADKPQLGTDIYPGPMPQYVKDQHENTSDVPSIEEISGRAGMIAELIVHHITEDPVSSKYAGDLVEKVVEKGLEGLEKVMHGDEPQPTPRVSPPVVEDKGATVDSPQIDLKGPPKEPPKETQTYTVQASFEQKF